MNVIIIILVILWNILVTVLGFLWKYKMQILYIVLAYFAFCIVLGIFSEILKWFTDRRKKKNELVLRLYLQEHCKMCGYVNYKLWKDLLPDFAVKEYMTSFDVITSGFAKEVESQYIKKNRDQWMHPVLTYLSENGMADIFELEQLQNEALEYTHYTLNAVLINREMEKLCKNTENDDKKIIEKIKLEKESIRKIHPQLAGNVNEVYRNAYKISEYLLTPQIIKNGNLVTHEFSVDELGIL